MKTYMQGLYAKRVLLGPGFHANMDACLANLADLPHGNLKAYNRTRAKTDADYTGMAKPQSQVPHGPSPRLWGGQRFPRP